MEREIKKEIENFVEILKEKWKEELISVVLFGSYASGKEREDSDIDILIIKKNLPKSRLKRRDEIYKIYKEISKNLREKISTIILDEEEAKITKPFYLDMTLHCEILFDKNNFFRNIIEKLKEKLQELKAERKIDKDGYPYWILKADYKLGEEIIL